MEELFLFFVGGGIYIMMEVLYRGWSHWSMFFLGGACFLCLGRINRILPKTAPLLLQMLIGAILITVLELAAGLVVNIGLGWNIWDYSQKPFNFLGQVCLTTSIGWYFLSAAGIVFDDYLRYWLFGREKPQYKLI